MSNLKLEYSLNLPVNSRHQMKCVTVKIALMFCVCVAYSLLWTMPRPCIDKHIFLRQSHSTTASLSREDSDALKSSLTGRSRPNYLQVVRVGNFNLKKPWSRMPSGILPIPEKYGTLRLSDSQKSIYEWCAFFRLRSARALKKRRSIFTFHLIKFTLAPNLNSPSP